MTNTQATAAGNKAYQAEIRLWKPVLAFILFTLVIGSAGYWVFQHHRESIKIDKQQELAGVAELKVAQITNWLLERKGDAQAIKNDPLFLREAERWLRRGSPVDETRTLLAGRLSSLQRSYADKGYTSVSLFDDKAMLRMSTLPDMPQMGEGDKKRLLESMRSGQIFYSDIHQGAHDTAGKFDIHMVIPVMAVEEKKPYAIGAILFNIDPGYFLFPLIERWPTPSASAESMLVRREGNEVVFLNKLRFRNNNALPMRLPLNQGKLLAVMALSGQEGLLEGVDYRGVPVIGVVSKIPDSEWAIASKVDKAEIYAPINYLANWVAGLTLLLFNTGCGIFIYWGRKQRKQARFFQEQYEREAEVRRLGEALKQSGEAIALADQGNRFVYINPAFSRLFGYSMEEVLGKSIAEVIGIPGATTTQPHQVLMETNQHGVFRSEVLRQAKDGRIIPVLLTHSLLQDEHGHTMGYVANLLDLTERRQAEQDLLTLYTAIGQSPISVIIADADANIQYVNPQFTRVSGYAFAEAKGQNPRILQSGQTPEETYVDLWGKLGSGQVWHGEFVNKRKNGEIYWEEAHIAPVTDAAGNVSQYVCLKIDITERKHSEKRLAESYLELQRLSSHLENLREDERAKIARDLHDEMGSLLVALKMRVAWLASKLPAEMPHLVDEAGHISGLTADAIKAMHEMVTQLRPNLREGFGFAATVEDYVSKFRQQTGIECTLVLPEEELAPGSNQTMTLFRILQESLSNVAKHARASRVRILFTKQDESLSLVIEDNGIGFDPGPVAHKEHSFGLIGIRERAMIVGGEARISSTPGNGTRISVTLTIPPHK